MSQLKILNFSLLVYLAMLNIGNASTSATAGDDTLTVSPASSSPSSSLLAATPPVFDDGFVKKILDKPSDFSVVLKTKSQRNSAISKVLGEISLELENDKVIDQPTPEAISQIMSEYDEGLSQLYCFNSSNMCILKKTPSDWPNGRKSYFENNGDICWVVEGDWMKRVNVIPTIKVDANPQSKIYAGNLLYVLNAKSNNVSVINTADKKVIATIKVGEEPKSATLIDGDLVVNCKDGAYLVYLDRVEKNLLGLTTTTTTSSTVGSSIVTSLLESSSASSSTFANANV